MGRLMPQPWKHPKTGMYWFRKAVPERLRAVVGKREIKFSLRTQRRTRGQAQVPGGNRQGRPPPPAGGRRASTADPQADHCARRRVVPTGTQEAGGRGDCRVYGFPRSGEHWAYGVARDARSDGWLQITGESDFSYWIEPGFSGSPVTLDEGLEVVIGTSS